MKDKQSLKNTLHRIDGKGYKAYKDIRDVYDFGRFRLFIDYVQGDPFASPSKAIVYIPKEIAGFPEDTYKSSFGRSREIALRDLLTRKFSVNAKRFSKGNRGSGKSGRIQIDTPGQEILERSSAFINDKEVEVRFSLSLPAFGRKVAGKHAIEMFMEEIP
ncbi:MAG: ABC-ATPase domain-containing protein, partial [Nanobdellota archaeon]